MMNMQLIAVVTTPSIYHGCSNQENFWEENLSGEEKFTLGVFLAVNMKHCGRQNVRKQKEIKGSDKYVTLDISLKFDSLDKMKITSSESKDDFGRPGKGLINSPSIKAKARPTNCKKARYAIENVSEKDL